MMTPAELRQETARSKTDLERAQQEYRRSQERLRKVWQAKFMIQSPGDFDVSRYKPIDERELNVRNRPFGDGIADHDRGIGQRVIAQSLIEKGWPSEAVKSMLMALEGSLYAFEKHRN
jgi:hypothetical protein